MTGERLVELHAEPPLSAKVVPGCGGPELVIVSSAASLLEGDRLRIDLRLSDGASLVVRSAAAQYAFPCDGPGESRLDVSVAIGPRSRLVWRPEPLVACAGCRHRTDTSVVLADDARLLWLDELVLGRTGESVIEIDVSASTSISRGDDPVLVDGFRSHAAGTFGPAGIGPARYLATAIDIGDGALADRAGAMELASGDRLLRVLAPDARRRLPDLLTS